MSTTASKSDAEYPTSPDLKGFFYLNAKNLELGIESKIYSNDKQVRRVKVENGQAIIRQLTEAEFIELEKEINKRKDSYSYCMLVMVIATKINGKEQTEEDFLKLTPSEMDRILNASLQLNFNKS